MTSDHAWLWIEAALLYVGLPLLFDQLVARGHRRLLFPGLWILSAAAMLALYRDPTFDGSRLWSLGLTPMQAVRLAGRTCLGVSVVGVASWRFAPDTFLALPRSRPGIWLLIAIAYPLLSALPQGIVWRVLLVQRYGPLFGGEASDVGVLVAGTLAFAFAHVIFRNVTALVLTAAGGLLFLRTYQVTRSLLASTLEHGVYGLAAFTFGIGRNVRLQAMRGGVMKP